MHTRSLTKPRALQADHTFGKTVNIVGGIINALLGLERLLGIDFSEILDNTKQPSSEDY